MNEDVFVNQLEKISEAAWHEFKNGRDLCLVDDEYIALCDSTDAGILITAQAYKKLTLEQTRRHLVEQAAEILSQYYRANPLSELGFLKQVRALVKEHGAQSFIQTAEQAAQYCLFIDQGEVRAEPQTSPTYAYGVCYEVDEKIFSGREREFTEWLESGEAYQQYLSMNVCRFSC